MGCLQGMETCKARSVPLHDIEGSRAGRGMKAWESFHQHNSPSGSRPLSHCDVFSGHSHPNVHVVASKPLTCLA